MERLQNQRGDTFVSSELRVECLTLFASRACRSLNTEVGRVACAQIAFVDLNQLGVGSLCQLLKKISIHCGNGLSAGLSTLPGVAISHFGKIVKVQILRGEQAESPNE